VVALDPKTGDVIALASSPVSDPNDFVKGLSVQQYSALSTTSMCRCQSSVARRLSPGTTVKPLLHWLLRYGAMTSTQTEFCGGIFTLPAAATIPRRQEARIAGHGAAHRCGPAMCISSELLTGLRIEKNGNPLIPLSAMACPRNRYTREKPGLYASPNGKKRAFKRAADQVWFPGETISMGIGQGPITVHSPAAGALRR